MGHGKKRRRCPFVISDKIDINIERERTNQHNYMQAARSTMTMTVVEEEGRTTREKKRNGD